MWILIPIGVTVAAVAHVIGEWMEESAESDYRETHRHAKRETERIREEIEQHLAKSRRLEEYRQLNNERNRTLHAADALRTQLVGCRSCLSEVQGNLDDVQRRQCVIDNKLSTSSHTMAYSKLLTEQRALIQAAATLTTEVDRLQQQKNLLEGELANVNAKLDQLADNLIKQGRLL